MGEEKADPALRVKEDFHTYKSIKYHASIWPLLICFSQGSINMICYKLYTIYSSQWSVSYENK